MNEFQTLNYAFDANVAKITLTQPQKLNALSPRMVVDLMQALDRAEADGARALLLTGEGRGFCAGADLTAAGEVDFASEDILEKLFNPFFERLLTLPFPVVSAVNGITAGGGCTLAFNSDFIVAARSAYFLQPFTRIGILPDGGATWTLPRLVGRGRAMELMMLGEKLPAEKAEAWGMVYKVVDDKALLAEANALAARLAAGPTVAYAMTRKAVFLAQQSGYGAALKFESDAQKIVTKSGDSIEGLTAFIEKRAPNFTGK